MISKIVEIELIKTIECNEFQVFKTIIHNYSLDEVSDCFVHYLDPVFYCSLLEICVIYQRIEFIIHLLKIGYDYSSSYFLFSPLLLKALKRGYLEIVNILFEHTDFTECHKYAQAALVGLYSEDNSVNVEYKEIYNKMLAKCTQKHINKAISWLRDDYYYDEENPFIKEIMKWKKL